jgi:hypothetical protein
VTFITDHRDVAQPPRVGASSTAGAWIAIGIFGCLSLYCAIRSQGFIAADACVHYLYSRFAISEPTRFVDVWARPLVTALYALPAALGGRLAVRVLAMAIAVGCGLVAMSISRRQNQHWPVLALIFTLGQPMLFLHSFGEMTELPFALVLGLAFVAYQSERIVLAAALVALTPLARPEGFGFLVLMAGAAIASRKWWALLILPLPLVIWDIVGWLISNRTGPCWRWLMNAWPYAGQSLYGSGNVLALLGQLPAIVSPLILPATIIGAALYLRSRDDQSHLRRCGILIAALPLFILLVHTLLYWTGRLASFGEVRYLLVVSPFWGVLSARGWEWFFTRFAWRRPLLWAGIATLAPPILVNAVRPVVPVPLPPDWIAAREIAAWCDSPETRQAHPRLMAAHPGIFYFLDVSPTDRQRIEPWTPASLRSAPAGTLLIWDPTYPEQNASADHAITRQQVRDAGWIELPGPQLLRQERKPGQSWHVFVPAR